MKNLNCLITLLIAGLMFVQTGCNKDEDKPAVIKLVVVKRSTGVLYTVDKSTGNLTQIGALTYNSEPLTGLRGLVYDPDTEKCYGGATDDGGGGFYSINISTGVATLLNDDPDDDWYGIADLLMAVDGNILASLYSKMTGNSSLVIFNKATGEDGTHNSITDGDDELETSGGLTYGSSATELILGGFDEIYYSSLTGLVSDTIPLIKTVNIDKFVAVMDLEKDSDETVFAMLYEYDDDTQYLVKLNAGTGEISELSVLTTEGIKTGGYHCLAFIPESKLP